jgi:hypothetical protein
LVRRHHAALERDRSQIRRQQRNEQSAVALTIKAMETVMPRELTEPHKGDNHFTVPRAISISQVTIRVMLF